MEQKHLLDAADALQRKREAEKAALAALIPTMSILPVQQQQANNNPNACNAISVGVQRNRLKDYMTQQKQQQPPPKDHPTVNSAQLVKKLKVEWLWAEQMLNMDMQESIRPLYQKKMPPSHWLEYISTSKRRELTCFGMIGGVGEIHNCLLNRFHIFTFEYLDVTRVRAFMDNVIQYAFERKHHQRMKWEWAREKHQRIPITPVRFGTMYEVIQYFLFTKDKNRFIDYTGGVDVFGGKQSVCYRIVLMFPSVYAWHFFKLFPCERTTLQPVMRAISMTIDDPSYEAHIIIEILVHYGLLIEIEFYYRRPIINTLDALPYEFETNQLDMSTQSASPSLLVPDAELTDCFESFDIPSPKTPVDSDSILKLIPHKSPTKVIDHGDIIETVYNVDYEKDCQQS